MTNGKVSRFWCWEPVLFFGEKFGKKRSNDIFDYPIGQQSGVANHPCPKPLKMWNDLIENYSEPGAIIYESFAGSGTTGIACQNLGRKTRMIEISPAYCAVILERFATAFPDLIIKRLE
jgi:DNA modification methylase